jgi:hypothetical protein
MRFAGVESMSAVLGHPRTQHLRLPAERDQQKWPPVLRPIALRNHNWRMT